METVSNITIKKQLQETTAARHEHDDAHPDCVSAERLRDDRPITARSTQQIPRCRKLRKLVRSRRPCDFLWDGSPEPSKSPRLSLADGSGEPSHDNNSQARNVQHDLAAEQRRSLDPHKRSRSDGGRSELLPKYRERCCGSHREKQNNSALQTEGTLARENLRSCPGAFPMVT